MHVIRPCLSCGFENPSASFACTRCGVELVAHAASAPAGTLAGSRLAVRRRGGILAIVAAAVIALAIATIAVLTRTPESAAEPLLRWSEPASVEAWASRALAKAGVPADTVAARVEPGQRGQRRAFVLDHPSPQPLPRIVRAVASMLVAAAAEGRESAAHLAVIRHRTRVVIIPAGEAADILRDDETLAAFLGLTPHELALLDSIPAEAGQGPAEQPSSPDGGSTPPSPAGPPAQPGTVGAVEPPPAGPEQATEPAETVEPPPADTPPAVATAVLPARVARGNGPVPPRAVAGTSAPLFRLQIAAGARRALVLRSLTVRAKGSMPEVEDIDWITLQRETDLSGRGKSRPVQLGSQQSFVDEDGEVTFAGLEARFGDDGLPLSLVLVADLGRDIAGGAIEISLRDADAIVIEDETGQRVPVLGVPVRGPKITAEGTIPVDEEQARLDQLALEGPDAVDPNVERMLEEARQAERQQMLERAQKERAASPPRR